MWQYKKHCSNNGWKVASIANWEKFNATCTLKLLGQQSAWTSHKRACRANTLKQLTYVHIYHR